MRAIAPLLACLLLACAAPPQPASPPVCPPSAAATSAPPAPSTQALAPALAPYAFLLGAWQSPPALDGATGGSSFEVGAQGRVILRRNFSESPKGRHDDLMMMFALPQGGVRAVYADNEGHAIDYGVTATDDPKSAVFLSNEVPGAPRFRLSYRLLPDGGVSGKFEMQPPGAPEFKPYLDWTMRKTA